MTILLPLRLLLFHPWDLVVILMMNLIILEDYSSEMFVPAIMRDRDPTATRRISPLRINRFFNDATERNHSKPICLNG